MHELCLRQVDAMPVETLLPFQCYFTLIPIDSKSYFFQLKLLWMAVCFDLMFIALAMSQIWFVNEYIIRTGGGGGEGPFSKRPMF